MLQSTTNTIGIAASKGWAGCTTGDELAVDMNYPGWVSDGSKASTACPVA
ncbi:hypothetical protein LT85_1524 [Collimonas arenae]|uniref:Uncharacterized protein n=1 Tax=Collimonas arenae TaxID=279058 RepID=A0A0A1FCX0_9BURK|nr:hypothetical protein LT85_1524 [Collimonas arenae]